HRMVALLPGDPDHGGDPRLPGDLLLLPESLLPGVFPGSTRLCRRGTPWQTIQRGDRLPADPPEPASLLPLPVSSDPRVSLVRHTSRLLLRRELRHRRG